MDIEQNPRYFHPTQYIGYIPRKNLGFYPHRTADRNASQIVAFSWWFGRVSANTPIPAAVKVWSSGRCARCSKELTDPPSVARGIGPICWGHVRTLVQIRPHLLNLADAVEEGGYTAELWRHHPEHLDDIPAAYMAPILRKAAQGGVSDLLQALELLYMVGKEEDPEDAVKAMAGVLGHLAIHAEGAPEERRKLRAELGKLKRPTLPGWWLPDDPL